MLRKMFARESGQSMAEYALILALISVVAIVIMGTVGDNIVLVLTDVANALAAAV